MASLLKFGAARAVMQTKMANAHKAGGQNVREKAADKLHRRKSHEFGFACIAIVEIFKSDLIAIHRHNAMIGDGNAKDVTTEIFDEFLDAIEWGLDIDLPIFVFGFGCNLSDIEPAVVGLQLSIQA